MKTIFNIGLAVLLAYLTFSFIFLDFNWYTSVGPVERILSISAIAFCYLFITCLMELS